MKNSFSNPAERFRDFWASGIRPDKRICVSPATQILCLQSPVFSTILFPKKLKKAENYQEIQKTEVLHIRLTPDDKQLIKQYASMMNVSMAKFIEILLHRRRVIICENFPELIYHLAKIGTNINQIAHTANATQNVSQEQIESVKLLMRQAYGQLESFVKLYTEKDPNPPKSIGLHTGKAINNLADSVRRLEKRIEQIEKKC